MSEKLLYPICGAPTRGYMRNILEDNALVDIEKVKSEMDKRSS